MNNKLFNEMISGFVEAKKYRAGKKVKMRVSRVAFEPVSMLKFDASELVRDLASRNLQNFFVLVSERSEAGSRAPANHKVRHSDY